MKKIINIITYGNLRFYRISAKHNLVLSTELEVTITGLILGDLYAERKNSNSNTRLQFKQSIVNKDYVNHLYSLFSEYCGSEPNIMSSFDPLAIGGRRKTKNIYSH